jgi:hypothetical protein
MNEELRKILDDARAKGMSIDQLKGIVERYNAKNNTSQTSTDTPKVVEQKVVETKPTSTPTKNPFEPTRSVNQVGQNVTEGMSGEPTQAPYFSKTNQKLKEVEAKKANIDNIAKEELLKKEYIQLGTGNARLQGKEFVFNNDEFNQFKQEQSKPKSTVETILDQAFTGVGNLVENTVTGLAGFVGAKRDVPIQVQEQETIIAPIMNEKSMVDSEYNKLQSTLKGNNKALEVQKATGKNIVDVTLDELIPKTESDTKFESTKLAEFKKSSADALNTIYGRMNYVFNENEDKFNALDNLDEKIKTTQDETERNTLINEYNTIVNEPSIKEYFALQSKYKGFQDEIGNRLKTDFASATKDIEDNKSNFLFNKIVENTGGKLVAGILSAPYRVTMALGGDEEEAKKQFRGSLDVSQGIQDYLEQNSKFTDKYDTPSFYNQTNYKGYKLLVDENGNAYSLRDENLKEVNDEKGILSEWNNLEKKTKVENTFNPYSTLATTSQVVADMAPLFAGGYVTQGSRATATLLGGATIVAQTQNDIYDSVKDRTDLNEREKNAYAMGVSTALAGLNMAVTPKFELNLLGATSNAEKSVLKKFINENAVKYASGEITGLQVAKEYTKYFLKNAGKEVVQELGEEWLYEPLVQNTVTDITNKATGSNIEMQKIDANSMKDVLLPTVLATGLMSGLSSYRGKNELQLEALNDAVNNVDRFNLITDNLVANGGMDEVKATETKKIVSKIANTIEQANVTDETDKRNLTNLLFQNETIRVRMDGNISDELKSVYKKQIADNQALVDKIISNQPIPTETLQEAKLEVAPTPTTTQNVQVQEPSIASQKDITILEKKIELAKTLGEDTSDLEKQLKEKQDAVQEQISTKIVLPTQQLELGLSEVEQGNQEPKVATEQSIQAKEEVKVEPTVKETLTVETQPIKTNKTSESKVEPIRQLGTGANVYFETDGYRVNDGKDGKTYLIIADENDKSGFPLTNIKFDDADEAVFVAKKISEIRPDRLTKEYNIDKIVDGLKEEYKQSLSKEQPTSTTKSESNPALSDVESRKKEMQSENDKLIKRKRELANDRDDVITGEGKYKNFGKKERDAKLEEIRNEVNDIDSKQVALQKELKVIEAKETGGVELFDHPNTNHGSTNTIIYDIKNDKLVERENIVRGKTNNISVEDAAKQKFAKTLRGANQREINEAYTDKVKAKYEAEINDEINKYKSESLLSKEQVSTMDTKVDTKVEKVEPAEPTTPKVKLNPKQSWMRNDKVMKVLNTFTEPINLEHRIANYFISGGFVNKDSVIKEVGLNTADIKGMQSAYRNDKGGTIEELAEMLHEEDMSASGGEQSNYGDMQEYRDAIIDFFNTNTSLKEAVANWSDRIDKLTQQEEPPIIEEEDINYFENLQKEVDIYENYLSSLSKEQIDEIYKEYETSDNTNNQQTPSGQDTPTTTGTENTGTEQSGGGLEQSKEQTQPTLIGKDRIAQGLDELAQILGAKQNITGDNPKLIDALTKIGLGLIEEGLATIDNVIEKIKEKINNPNINVDDYKDAILSNMPTSKEDSIKKLVEQWKADGLSDTEIKNILSESETGKTFIDKLFPKEPKERSFSRTLEDMPTQVQNLVENKDYIPTTNPEQEAVADNFIKENGIEEATKILIDNKTSELSDAETNIVAMKLIKINNKNGNYKESARIFDEVAEKLTEAGRLIQTAALWNLMTEQGAVEYAMRLKSKGRNAQKEVVEQEVKTTKEKIIEIAREINGSKEIKDAIAKIYSKRERISKTKSQKAIDWLESIKVKDMAFTALPGVNLLPATYNTAINIIQTGIKANIMLNTAVAQAVKYIRENITADESFDESKFKKFILDNLPKIEDDAIKVAEQELGKKISDVVNAHYDIKEEYKKSLLDSILSKTDLTESEAKVIADIVETKFAQEADKKLDALEKKQKSQAKKVDDKIAKVESEIKAIENGTYKQDKKYPTTKSEKQKELDVLRKQKRELLGTEQPYVKIVDRINKGTISNADMKELLYSDIGLSNLDANTIAKIEEMHRKVKDAPQGSAEQRDRLADLLDFIDKEINGTDNWAIAKSLMYASLLSASSTQVKNFISNTMQMTAEAYVNSMLMLAKGDAKGISGLAKGLLVGLERGGLEAIKVLKTGYDPNKKVLLLDSNPKISRKDILESYTGNIKPISWAKYVRRLMVAADTLFYYGVKEMESYVLARQIALKSGLKGKALTDKINETLLKGESYYNEFKKQAIQEGYLDPKTQKRRIFELIEMNRDRAITDKADISALKATYNNDPVGFLGDINRRLQNAKSLRGSSNKLIDLIVTSIIPFTRVISNVVNEQLNWTPLGYARALTEKGSIFSSPEQMKLTNEERSKLVIKATTGMLLAIGFLAYALKDDDDEDKIFDVTANGYGNSYKNTSLYPLGWKPYTIGIKMPNGKWIRYSYQNTPFGQLLGMIGTIADSKKYNKDADMTDRVGLFASTTANQMFSASALQGASTLFDALGSKDSENMNKILELAISKAKMPIPNIAKEAYNIFDNQLYDKSDIKGMVINNVPVFQLLGRPKLNVFGEPIKKSRYGALLLLPETDNTLKSLYEVGVVPSMPLKNKKIYGKEMNNEQFYDYVETRGKYLRKITEENLDYITSITDEKQAKKAYDKIENQASNYAEDVIYNRYFKK